MIIGWIVILVVVVIAIKWGVNNSSFAQVSPRSKSVLDILDERYARGEINENEYQSRKKHLLR